MKMNKKGFTLIEMLVVIAIIAVLVAIVIPTVTSATDKAAAATNAANLRSLVAEATTDYLGGKDDSTGLVGYVASTKTFTVSNNAPKAKKMDGVTGTEQATITVDANGQITAKYGDYTIADFAAVAENGGSLVASTGNNTSGGQN